MKTFKFKWLLLSVILSIASINTAWAYTIIRSASLNGDDGDSWSNSDAMTQVGSTNVYYRTYTPKATTDLFFRIGTGSDWTTKKNSTGIDNLNSNIVMVGDGSGDNNIKFQVPASVPVTIYYNDNTDKIWIKVDSYKTDVLNGKEMFYYGYSASWGGNFAHFFDNGTRKFGNYAATSFADNTGLLAIGVYDVSGSTNYSASNNSDWSGVNHTGMAAGCQIQTYSDGENKCYYNAASTFSFGSTAYTIVVGQTIASFPSISFTSKTSGVGSSLSLENYYYSTATSGQTWNVFTPGTTESSLAAGTYYIKAIATDGAIYMASTNYITLTVNSAPVMGVANASSVTSSSATFNATVTLNSNTTTSYGFKYGSGSSYDTAAELQSGTAVSTSGALDASTFSKNVTGLSASTTYYYISYVVVGGVTYYSSTVKSFTTSAAATYNLSVVAGTGISAVTGSTNNISAAQNIAITATVASGYTWNTWTKTGSGTLSTYTAGTKNQTVTVGTVGDITLTASATENTVTISPTNSYDHGNPGYSNPTASNSGTVGIVSTSELVAPDAGEGYEFAGWTLSNNLVVTDGDEDTDQTITVRTNGDGNAVSATANYNEILDSRWHLVGNSSDFPDGWNVNSTTMMKKKSGECDDKVVYFTVNVTSTDAKEFKIVDDNGASDDIWYGYSNEAQYQRHWTSTTSYTVYSGSGNSQNLKYTPTVTGSYEFKVDYSDADNVAVTVTFPTTYQVHYDVGTVKGASDNPSAQDDESNAISDGDYVLSGTEVTFTAEEAATGYTWEGWYDAATTSGNKLSTDDDLTYTTTISAATTVYAVYTENSYTVTVNAGSGGKVSYDGGSASSRCSASAGVATESQTISAIPDAGYAFVGWTNVDNEHHITAFDADWNDTNKGWDLTVNADDNTTITANFEPRFALVGAIVADGNPEGGMPGWDLEDAVAFSYSTGTYTLSRTLTSPNTGYAFKIIDRLASSWIWRGYSDEENNLAVDNTTTYTLTEDGGNNVYFDSRGVGSYTFTVVEETITGVVYPKVKIQDGANSHVVTWGYVSDNGEEGGTITSVVDGEATPNSIASGKYVKNGGSITATAAANPGYRFIDFRTSSTYGGGSQLSTSNPYEVASVTADQNIYAQFAENLCTVTITTADASKGSITVGGEDFDWGSTTQVGVYNYKSLVVTPAAGYYFSGWTLSDTPDFTVGATGESGSSTNLTGLGGTHGSTGTLTANFKELEKIYFRNLSTMDDGAWANVYVYFGVDWNGSENAVSNANAAYKVAMTQVGASDVYWAYVPRAFTSSSGTAIAFSNQSVSTSTAINTGLAATRNDYNKALQMYVPSVTWANHGAHYYNDGYWRNYPVKVATGAGYYLQTTRGTNLVEFKGQADNSDKIECTVRVDQSNTDKTFHIKSAGGVYYEPYNYSTSTYPKISSSAPTMTMKSGDTDGLTVTLTSEGIYTFIIDQSSDIMELTVGYPVSIGDYRLKHTYNDGSAKTTYSDVIKSGDAAEGQTISMYLSTAGTESLVLQKCTAIVAGVPAWDAGDGTNLSGVLTTVGTNYGVYQFDVAVSGDQVASVPTATKYTGPYYIKTDGATGGWATYKQNSMDENTLNYDTDHPEKSFNYYYCKYYNYAGTNLKCVIANDYCNALTDTLVGDAVIGIENQTTPSAASVRFSYNTYTNEIKRSYLGASVNSDFLRILGNTAAGKPHIYDKAETTYDDSHADSYITFEDKQNWRYEIDVKADVNARAKLTATFNGQTQYFWGHAGEVGEEWDDENTEELFGGTSGTYGLTLVYDFKTNKLITAWKPTGTINSDLSLKSDIFLLREHQESPTTITFGLKDESNYASLTDVKTVYSVLRLNRWKLNNRAHPEDLDTDHCDGGESDYTTYHAELEVNQDDEDGKWLPQAERELYFISFPFDVKMSDIISFGNYYDTWGIMYYDGKGRAKSGYWVDSESNWKYFTPEEFATETLNAYEGYLIGIDLSAMAYNNTSFWTNNSSEVDIYFPSKTAVSTITQKAVTVTIDTVGYKCSINRDFGGSDGDRRIKDSHWHCIGVPSYADLTHAINNGAPADASWSNTSLLYLYEWDSSKNEHSIKKSSEFDFKAMYAYLVQYAGTTLTWAASSATGPTSIVARRMKTEELRDRQFNLQLMQSGKEADHTYIRLSDDEEVTTGFEFNHDVSKMMLSGANIYTLIGKEQAAANSLPLNLEQTTVVPVGVKIATNGDYTFSISEGTQGVGVTLIDNETGTRTSLSALDYEISLEAGTYDERFLLEISPIKNTPTSIEETTGDGLQVTNARKVMIDGLLYIVKDGVIYDARGAVVK